jgi:hypothetical protein
LEADKQSITYGNLMKKLPKTYLDKYHFIIQWAAMFILAIHGAIRGREGIDLLEKCHFKKVSDPTTGIEYYEKATAQRTKNHQTDGENLKLAGIIPFIRNKAGLNPGRFLELYVSKLNPVNPHLFQRPRRPGKAFSLHDPTTTMYYEVSKVGENTVAEMMPKLSAAVNVPRIINNSIRSTAVQRLNKNGFEDRAIMNLSGHKDAKSLNHYNPSPELSVKIAMAAAILAADSDDEDDDNDEAPPLEDDPNPHQGPSRNQGKQRAQIRQRPNNGQDHGPKRPKPSQEVFSHPGAYFLTFLRIFDHEPKRVA